MRLTSVALFVLHCAVLALPSADDNPWALIPETKVVEPPKPVEPVVLTPGQALLDEGRVYPGAHVGESEQHPLLVELAKGHAHYMARYNQQGHQHYQARYDQVARDLGMQANEICAESWPWEANASLQDLAKSMFKAWAYWPRGHWDVAKVKHRYAGAWMAKGSSGVWYACILVADGEPKQEKDEATLNAEQWQRIGEPVPVAVDCPTCPSRVMYVGQTAEYWWNRSTGQQAHIISDDAGVLGIWYYGNDGSSKRWVAKPHQDPTDKAQFQQYHWRFSPPSCGMNWCVVHGGGWILEANK